MVKKLLDGVAKALHRRKAIGRFTRHGPSAHVGDFSRNILGKFALGRDDRGDHFGERRRVVRRSPREHLEKGRPEQVNVRVRAHGTQRIAQHFRGHVVRRPCHRERGGGVRQPRVVGARGDGNAPVEDVDLAKAPEHDVFGLEVPVHNAALVREGDRIAHTDERAQVPVEQVPRTEALPHRLRVLQQVAPDDAFNALQHDGRPALGVHRQVVDGNHVRVLEAAGYPGLAKQLKAHVAASHRVLQRLHGDRSVERHLPRETHDAHASFAEGVRRHEPVLGLRTQKFAELFERFERRATCIVRRFAWRVHGRTRVLNNGRRIRHQRLQALGQRVGAVTRHGRIFRARHMPILSGCSKKRVAGVVPRGEARLTSGAR